MTPRLGQFRPQFDTSCGFSTHPMDPVVSYCGRPSVLHLATGFGDDDLCMYACDEHASVAQALAADWHPTGPVCGVPDSIWHRGDQPGFGYCSWPAADAIEFELAALQPATVSS